MYGKYIISIKNSDNKRTRDIVRQHGGFLPDALGVEEGLHAQHELAHALDHRAQLLACQAAQLLLRRQGLLLCLLAVEQLCEAKLRDKGRVKTCTLMFLS